MVVDNTVVPSTLTTVTWSGKTNITATYVAAGLVSHVAIDSTGAVFQQLVPFTNTQHRQYIVIGSLVHVNLTNLDAINQFGEVVISPSNQLSDLSDALGKFNMAGNVFSANGANLNLNKSTGTVHSHGSNWANNQADPNVVSLASLTALTFQYRFQTGTNGATGIAVNPSIYDVAGVSTAVPANKFTIQRIYSFVSNNVKIQPGQIVYNTLSDAKAGLQTETFTVEPSIQANGILRGFLIVRQGTTSLLSSTDAFFYEAGKFSGQTGVGGQSVSSLQNAYDNSLNPEILTDATRDAISIKRGSAADTDNILEGLNGAGSTTFTLKGNGAVSSTGLTSTGIITDGFNSLSTGTLALAFGTKGVAAVTPNASGAFTTTVPAAGTRCDLIITTSGVSNYTMTFGTGFSSSGTLDTGVVSGTKFIVSFVSDGTYCIETSRTSTAGYIGSSTTYLSDYDGLALDYIEQNSVGAISTLTGGVGWPAAGVCSSSDIVSRTTHGGLPQKRLAITGPGEFGRKMPWLGKWNTIRIGILIRINGSATFDSQFSLGVCSGTSLMYGAGAANCLNSMSVAQYEGGASDDFTYAAGTQNDTFVSSTYEGLIRTGGVDTQLVGNFTTVKMTAPANEPSLAAYFVEITRPVFTGNTAIQYTYQVHAPNTSGRTEYSVPRTSFLEMMNTGPNAMSTDFNAQLVSTGHSNFQTTSSETNGVLDTINFYWQNASNPIEIAAYGVRKLA
jgi:hypothetical protein